MPPTAPEKTIVAIENRRQDQKESAPQAAAPDLGKRLQNVQELLFGDAQRMVEGRLNEAEDRQREHADDTAERFRTMAELFERRLAALQEEIRGKDREQTAARRQLVSRLGDAIKDMARDA